MNWPRCSIGVIWGHHALMSSFRHGNVAAPLYRFGSIAMPASLAADCKHLFSRASKYEPIGNRMVKLDHSEVRAPARLRYPPCCQPNDQFIMLGT